MNEQDKIPSAQPVNLEQAGGRESVFQKPIGLKHRMVGLDVMRFVAVMMVLYCHSYAFHSTRYFFAGKIGWFFDVLYQLRIGCWVSIDMFFVLSGFLISGLLFQELKKTGTISVGRFLVRRGFKIYPVFWVMIIATIIGKLIIGQPLSWKPLLVDLLFIQNYVMGPWPSYIPTYWGVTWSLGVEEHFYFMMAGLVWLLKRRCGSEWKAKLDSLPKLFLCVAVGCLIARWLTCEFVIYEAKTKFLFLFATHCRMDALFFGVLISYYWHNRWSDEFKNRLMDKRWLLAAGGLVLLSTAIYQDDEWFRIFGFVLTYLGSGYLMLSLLSLDRSPSNIIIRTMAWFGRHSYSVYLWHMMVGYWLLPYITFKGRNMTCWTTNLFIFIAASWAVGTIMSLAVEFPMLRVRERYFPWISERSARQPDKPDGAPQVQHI